MAGSQGMRGWPQTTWSALSAAPSRPKKSSSSRIHSIHKDRRCGPSRLIARRSRSPRGVCTHKAMTRSAAMACRDAVIPSTITTSAGGTMAHLPRPWPSGSLTQSRTRKRAGNPDSRGRSASRSSRGHHPSMSRQYKKSSTRTTGAPPQAAASARASVDFPAPPRPSTATRRTAWAHGRARISSASPASARTRSRTAQFSPGRGPPGRNWCRSRPGPRARTAPSGAWS